MISLIRKTYHQQQNHNQTYQTRALLNDLYCDEVIHSYYQYGYQVSRVSRHLFGGIIFFWTKTVPNEIEDLDEE